MIRLRSCVYMCMCVMSTVTDKCVVPYTLKSFSPVTLMVSCGRVISERTGEYLCFGSKEICVVS